MKWITAAQLSSWADTIAARTKFPELIADLINASITDLSTLSRLRFPSGDKGQVRGFDGILEITQKYPFIPEGYSVWEFGSGKDANKKAEEDYNKRTSQLSEESRKETTFVFVSLRTWDNPKKKLETWMQEKKDKDGWKNVIYLDGVEIERWLHICPAIAAKYSQSVLGIMPKQGIMSIDTYWDEFTNKFKPPLIEEVLLAGRSKQVEQLYSKLRGDTKLISYAADSSDEVIAFIIAAIRSASDEDRLFFESRSLIVSDENAARDLMARKLELIVLPIDQARNQVGALSVHYTTIASAGIHDRTQNHFVLQRPTTTELAHAFEKMRELDFSQGYALARSCGRSLSVLARLNPSGHKTSPAWITNGNILIPALLAGAWNSNNAGDRSILSCLASNLDHEVFLNQLRALIKLEDSPLERINDVWSMRSSVDAFLELGHLLGEEHLRQLRLAINTVFSTSPTKPNASDVFRPKEQQDNVYSQWLRDGLMNILLHIAVFHKQAEFHVRGMSAQEFVNDIVKSVIGLSSDIRFVTSFEGNLALLAEAAPEPFIEALERLLRGDTKIISSIFDENNRVMSNKHVRLLWALEMLAWEPDLLLRVSTCLAKLAEVDSGGKLSNRPINSLQSLFISWAPNTYANVKQRSRALSFIVTQFPTIAWDLLVKLLPNPYSTSMQNPKPRYRESSQEAEPLLYRDIWESDKLIIKLAIENTHCIPERWIILIKAMSRFQEQSINEMIDAIEIYLKDLDEKRRFYVWDALLKEVNRHRKYSNADWSFNTLVLERLDLIIEDYKPIDNILINLWLFDEYLPDVGNSDTSFDETEAYVERKRIQCVKSIIDIKGLEGIIEVAKQVKMPTLLSDTIIKIGLSKDQLIHLINLLIPEDECLSVIINSIVSYGIDNFKDEWIVDLRLIISNFKISSARVAQFLFFLPENKENWIIIKSFGEEVDKYYWFNKQPRAILGDSDEEISLLIENYLKVGRPFAAIVSVLYKLGKLQTEMLVLLLEQGVIEINGNTFNCNSMTVYYFEQIFDELRIRTDILEDKLSTLEFTYFPLLRKKTPTLNKKILSDPIIFMEIIKMVYLKVNHDQEDGVIKNKSYADVGYQLLNSLNTLPGQVEKNVNYEFLYEWCLGVRELARELDIERITDLHIGRILAHAPVSELDNNWPHESIKKVIEDLASDHIDNAIILERFNMRGLYSKSFSEGGEQERQLSAQALKWAEGAYEFPRTHSILKKISKNWLKEAVQEDEELAQRQLRE